MFTVQSLWRSCCHASVTKGSMVINSGYIFLAILKWQISLRYEISFLVVLSIKFFFSFFFRFTHNFQIIYIESSSWLTLFAVQSSLAYQPLLTVCFPSFANQTINLRSVFLYFTSVMLALLYVSAFIIHSLSLFAVVTQGFSRVSERLEVTCAIALWNCPLRSAYSTSCCLAAAAHSWRSKRKALTTNAFFFFFCIF